MVDDDVASFEVELDAIVAVEVGQCHAHELFLRSAVHRCDVISLMVTAVSRVAG